jgi:hypothetical protein
VAKPDELHAARQILDNIRESAYAEEATGFDPSGSSGRDSNGAPLNGDESESANSQLGLSNYTDDTSLSQSMPALDLEGLEASGTAYGTEESERNGHDFRERYDTQFETFDEADREALLIETFPGVKPFDINWTLKKFKGDIGLAIEELLNQVFLEDGGHRPRGIDGFSENEPAFRPRKDRQKKMKTKFSEPLVDSENEIALPGTMENKWETADRDIKFISSRARIDEPEVRTIYHRNGASVPATVNALIDERLPQPQSKNAVIALHARELSQDFPNIPFQHLVVLTQITHPSTSSAHELAKALTSRPRPNRNSLPIQIEFRLPPPDLSKPVSKPKPKSHNAVFPSGNPPPLFSSAALTANEEELKAKRNEDFAKAAAAYRRGKSDHLMSGAAAFFSDRGRDYDAKAKAVSSATADALVASQSSATTLDLHGVSVKDGVRIARERVTAWWAGKGDGSYAGFKIITGKGTHSEGGRGKLGPEVSKMLMREGWRVEIGSGVLLVTGVVMKKK